MDLKAEIQKFFQGDISDTAEDIQKYSRDTSLFTVTPKLIVFPKDSADLRALVKWVGEQKSSDPTLSLTIRSAGSDMTGGPLNESIIADVTRYMNHTGEISEEVTVEPGVFYRDFEPKTLEKDLILPCFPGSKSLCALGGMFGNNCAGEKTLRYGKMENFVLESKVIFSDGQEYTVRPLTKDELEQKVAQDDFEGNIYKQVYNLLQNNQRLIQDSKPQVSKNSAGYYLWNVWDGETFDLNRLIVGSQGTLGLVTSMKIRLVPVKKHHDLVAIFFKSWDEMPSVVNALLPFQPESLETFDEETLKLGIRFMPKIAKKAGSGFFTFLFKFLPEALIGVRMGGLPKLIVLAEIAENTEDEVKAKVRQVTDALKPFNVISRVIEKDSEEDKFWIMRRESFNLLRQNVGDKHTAPFVEDFCIPTDKVPEFLPRAKKILVDAGIKTNIAGHAGNGNFHIIPLMDLSDEKERNKIVPVAEKFYDLVGEYKGSITAEHNDGIVRTPFLGKMYSQEMLDIFKQTKAIFDPQNILNPGKKVGGSIEYLEKHIAIG